MNGLDGKTLRALMRRAEEEAEAGSPFKRWQLVRAHRPSGLVVTAEGMHDGPVDPNLDFDARVIGWDSVGQIEITTGLDERRHLQHWCWTDDMLEPVEREDWADVSSYGRGKRVYFWWELPDFNIPIGKMTGGVIEGPHVAEGDWIVRYQHPSMGKLSRVVHETQFIKPVTKPRTPRRGRKRS